MLELVKSKRRWEWMACGKHPVAGDYFRTGANTSVFDAFSNWVETGFHQCNGKIGQQVYSWRFWAKGYEKEALICGVVRDSSDRLGRPYPLLVMGSGPVKGLKQRWSLLPTFCDDAWRQMENISTKRFEDISSAKGKTALRDQMLERINGMLARGQITNIYFKEFVVQ